MGDLCYLIKDWNLQRPFHHQVLVENLLANLGAEKAAFREDMEREKLRRRRLQELIAELKQGLQSERATGARFKNALDEIAKVMETATATPTETTSA